MKSEEEGQQKLKKDICKVHLKVCHINHFISSFTRCIRPQKHKLPVR